MRRLTKPTKLTNLTKLTCAALALAGTASLATLDAPASAGEPTRVVRVTVNQLIIHDDGDNVGCGDFYDMKLVVKPSGQTETRRFHDRWGNSEYGDDGWQVNPISEHYMSDLCSDNSYNLPYNDPYPFDSVANYVAYSGVPGTNLNVVVSGHEWDTSSYVGFSASKALQVPQPGQSAQFYMEAETATKGSDHVRITYLGTISTSTYYG